MNAVERLRAVLCAPDGEVVIDGTDTDRSIVAEALNELDAALSQTAGVVDDSRRMDFLVSKCVEVREPARYGSLAMFRAQDVSDEGEGYRNDLRERIDQAMLASAPSASGGEDGLVAGIMAHFCNAIDNLNDMPVSDEWARKWTAKAEFLIGMGPDPGNQSLSDTPTAPHPDALPDGTLSKSTAKRVEALASASVSERNPGAEDAMHWIDRYAAGIDEVCQLDRVEQALTQQRGEFSDVGNWLWVQLMDWCRSQRIAPATQDKLFGIVGRARKQFPATTPQPSADAVRELVKRILNWQPLMSINKADRLYQILIAAGITFESVTDELESLLSGGSHA